MLGFGHTSVILCCEGILKKKVLYIEWDFKWVDFLKEGLH